MEYTYEAGALDELSMSIDHKVGDLHTLRAARTGNVEINRPRPTWVRDHRTATR